MKIRIPSTLRLLPLATASFLSLAFCLQGGQEPGQPGGASILDRFVEVTGGRDAHASLHNIVSGGVFQVTAGEMRGTFQSFEAEPDRSLSILQIEGGDRIEEGTSGKVAWARSSKHGARLKAGEERSVALREATFNSRLHWRVLYPNVECNGTEIVEGRKCYRVVLSPAAGRPITHFYDVESGLLAKSLIILKGPSGFIPSENFYREYQKSCGVLFPRKLTHRVNSEETQVLLESVECNTELAPGLFELPPEVRSLAAKSALPPSGIKQDKP